MKKKTVIRSWQKANWKVTIGIVHYASIRNRKIIFSWYPIWSCIKLWSNMHCLASMYIENTEFWILNFAAPVRRWRRGFEATRRICRQQTTSWCYVGVGTRYCGMASTKFAKPSRHAHSSFLNTYHTGSKKSRTPKRKWIRRQTGDWGIQFAKKS